MLVNAARTNPHIGSTTAVMAAFETSKGEEGEVHLQTCNLGDSGYLIVRPSEDHKTIFRSKEQQWAFNSPEQAGTHCELPYLAIKNKHSVVQDDIVVMGSDGLFDNLYDEDIKKCLRVNLNSLDRQADCIVTLAEFMSYK